MTAKTATTIIETAVCQSVLGGRVTMPISEIISPTAKWIHIQFGAALVFGSDTHDRRKLPQQEAIERFDELWKTTLSREVEQARKIAHEEARDSVGEAHKQYTVPGYEFRQLSYCDVPFVARLTETGVCDHFWSLGVNRDDSRLNIDFESAADKSRFNSAAKKCGWNDPRELGLRLLMDFVRNFDGPKESRRF
jgi:hypothetical protein